MKSGEEHNSLL